MSHRHALSLSLALGLLGLPLVAHAIVHPADHQARGRKTTMDGRPLAAIGDVRVGFGAASPGLRALAASDPGAASRLSDFLARHGDAWWAWDRRAGGLAMAVFAEGPRDVALASGGAAARRWITRFLTDNAALLAPAVGPGELVLVSHTVSGRVSEFGFVQTRAGFVALDSGVSVRVVGDRIAAVRAHTIDARTLGVPASFVSDSLAEARARAAFVAGSIAAAAKIDDCAAIEVSDPVILALGGGVGVWDVRLVRRVTLRSGRAGQSLAARRVDWVYVDAGSGEAVASEPALMFDDLNVNMAVTPRLAGASKVSAPAPLLSISVDGQTLLTNVDGIAEVAADAETMTFSSEGPLIEVIDQSGQVSPPSLDVDLQLAAVTWDAGDDAEADAVVTTFIHAGLVKARVKQIAGTSLPWLDETLVAGVNVDGTCNAYSTGDSIFFYAGSADCENTGRIADVVYHEFGHSVHTQSLVPGVGIFDGALSEGISDYLSATITDDASLAPGFFYTQEPIRELDPPDSEWRWPEDRGPVHAEGRIIGGTLWDLRKRLKADLGTSEGVAQVDRLWFEAIRRATGIPSMFPEVLLADDDDGRLQNGTPNACAIKAEFARHGLYQADVVHTPPNAIPPGTNQAIVVEVGAGLPGCPDQLTGRVYWRDRSAPSDVKTLIMVASDGQLTATLPAQAPGTVLQYRIELEVPEGGAQHLPTNIVDPWYEIYFGPVTPIYCTDFEASSGGAEGWTLTGFEVGDAVGTWGDPGQGIAGSRVLGTSLGGPYLPNTQARARSPNLDVSGFGTVRLQYWRWLEVEDGVFDTARIAVNGEPSWENHASPEEGAVKHNHHRDGEWRFHDVDLTPYAEGGEIVVEFSLASDGGLEFGGWNVDGLCVVGIDPIGCGNGVVEEGEECDDGAANSDVAPNACRSTCMAPTCGDGVVDTGEECDGSVECSATCAIEGSVDADDDVTEQSDGGEGGCGCTSRPTRRASMLPLGLLLVGAGLCPMRRRRRSARCA